MKPRKKVGWFPTQTGNPKWGHWLLGHLFPRQPGDGPAELGSGEAPAGDHFPSLLALVVLSRQVKQCTAAPGTWGCLLLPQWSPRPAGLVELTQPLGPVRLCI